MGITFSDVDLDTDENTVQIAALTPTDNAVIIGNGTAWVAESGTTLKTSLGLTIGTDVQAYDADLATWAGVTPGTGIATALAVNVGTAGAPVVFDGALGTPSSGTLTNATGLPISTGVSGLGTGVATFLATPSSANLSAALTDELGSDKLIFSAGTLAVASGKTLTASNTLTLTATDGSTLAIGTGGTLGTAAYVADSTLAHLAGTEIFTGLKTFTTQCTKFQANSEVYSIALAYGSGTGVAYIGASNSATPDLQISNAAGSSIATFSNDRSTTLSGIVYATGGSFSGAGVPVVINSTNNALVASIGYNGVVGGYIGTNGSTGLALTEVSATVYLTLTSTAATITGGGLVVGAPTGGNKGAGTINATAVYDDNTLLTCYVLDAAIDGTVDMAKWDEKVPNRVIPAKTAAVEDTDAELDAEGVYPTKLVEVEPATIEERIHADARKFVARLGTDSDPLDIDKYADHWKTKRHLTSMPNESTFDPVAGMPMGAWVQRLIETVEIQAVHIDNLNQRLKALEAAQ